jgi:hypothetical protein
VRTRRDARTTIGRDLEAISRPRTKALYGRLLQGIAEGRKPDDARMLGDPDTMVGR